MNKLFALAFLGLTTSIAHAQTTPLTKGRGLLSGSIGYQSVKYRGSESQDLFTFSPTVGYFVADNLAIGLNGNLQTYGSGAYGTNNFSVGPFVRYYRFVGGSDKFALYGQGGVGYRHYSGSYRMGYVDITPGLAFFPVPRFGLEASLRGLSYSSNFNDTHSFDFGLSLQNIQLGAAYYFGK
ncbi:MAG: hypothetical protein EOO37_01090 [Cytophagaceae bacterium]|nr:MAG: hypothetical protein EOO37_01090 [Cytophagaceae bacterium]